MNYLKIVFLLALVNLSAKAQNVNTTPLVNRGGKIEHAISLGDLSVGPKSLPILLHFKSDAKTQNTSLVPNYEIPLLESRAVKVDENNSNIILPTGQLVRLYRRGKSAKYSASHPWSVTIVDKRIFLENKAQKLSFYQGRIQSWKMESGEVLNWIYGPTGLDSLTKGNGMKVLGLTRTGEALKLEHESDEAEVKWSFINVPIKKGGTPIFMPMLEGYSSFGQPSYEVENEIVDFTLKQTHLDEAKQEVYSYRYLLGEGKVKSLNSAIVDIKKIEGFHTPQISIMNKYSPEIIHKATYWDGSTEKVLQANGSVFTKNYFFTPQGRKLRKSTIDDAGITEILYRAHYDNDGNLIRDQKGEFTRKFIDGKFHVYKNNKLIRKY